MKLQCILSCCYDKRTHNRNNQRGEKIIWAPSSRAWYVWFFHGEEVIEAAGHMRPTNQIGERDKF